MLTTRSAGAVGVNAQVGRVDGHGLGFIGLCQHSHRASTGVNAALCFGGGHALHAVASRFKAQGAKHMVTLDANHHLFVATQLTGRFGHDFGAPAFALKKLGVHAKQVARKKR